MTDKYTEGVVRQAVKEIVSSIIGLPSDAAELDESLEQVCDSLDFIDIAMELEDHFVIEFEETELERMLTVDTIVEVVLKKVS